MDGFYGVADWQWWWQGCYTAILVIVGLWWPGWWCLRRLTRCSRAFCFWAGNVVGTVWLAIIAATSGFLGVYWLVYPYFVCCLITFIYSAWRARAWWSWTRFQATLSGKKILLYLLFLGLVLQLPAVFGSGLRRQFGLNFIMSNYHDGLMHIGFINSLSHQFPPIRPEINLPLSNYHYFSDLVLAQLVRLGVKSLHLYFQFFPLWWSLVMTGVIYEGVREVTRSHRVAGWTTLVFLLASDGAFWLTFFFPHGQGWDMASLDNGTDQFFNPPYVMAKVIFILAWVTLNHFWQTHQKRVLVLLVGLLIPLTLFKVYWSVLFASGWCLVWLARTVRTWWRRGRMSSLWSELVAIVVVGIGSGLLLASATTGQAAKMAFVPFLWPKLLVSSEHLGWDEWALRQQVYQQVPSWKRQTWDYVLLILVALIYVFGARLAGGWTSWQARRYLSGRNYMFLVVPAVVWTFVGFNFLQGVGNYNSFNFLIIAAVALLIPLGVNCHVWWRTIGGKIFVIALLASFLPRLAYNWSEYLGQSLDGHGRVVNYSELELLANLQKYTTWDDILLVNPDNDRVRAGSLYPALAGRRTYVSSQIVLETHDLKLPEREQAARDVLHDTRLDIAFGLARDLGVDYVVLDDWDLMHENWEMPIASREAVWRSEAGAIIPINP